jgi:hypothetical protein
VLLGEIALTRLTAVHCRLDPVARLLRNGGHPGDQPGGDLLFYKELKIATFDASCGCVGFLPAVCIRLMSLCR